MEDQIDAWVVSTYKETDGEIVFLELALSPTVMFKTEDEAVEYCENLIKGGGGGWDRHSPFVIFDRVESDEDIGYNTYHITQWYVITAMEFGVTREDQTEAMEHPGVMLG